MNDLDSWLPQLPAHVPPSSSPNCTLSSEDEHFLLHSERYKHWYNGPKGQSLWITGGTATGKTFAFHAVARDLERRAQTSEEPLGIVTLSVTHDRKQKTVVGMLLRFMKQLVCCEAGMGMRTAMARYKEFYSQSAKPWKPSPQIGPTVREVTDLLQEAIAHFADVIVVLHEFHHLKPGDQADIISALRILGTKNCILSYPVETSLKALLPAVSSLRLEDAFLHPAGDLSLLIRRKIDRSESLRCLFEGKEDARDQLYTKLSSKCGGSYLIASLQVEAIGHPATLEELWNILHALPTCLRSAYKAAWSCMTSQSPKEADLVQRMVACLLLDKDLLNDDGEADNWWLRGILAASIPRWEYDEASVPDEGALLAMSCGLVVLNKSTGNFCFPHDSAFEILKNLVADCYPSPRSLIGASYMVYLTEREGWPERKIPHRWMLKHCTASELTVEGNVADLRFVRKVLDCWCAFAPYIREDPLIMAAFRPRVDSWNSMPFHGSTEQTHVGAQNVFGPFVDTIGRPHIAAWLGITEHLDMILRCHAQTSSVYGRAPLHYAVEGRQTHIIKAMLDNPDVDFSAKTNIGLTATRLASYDTDPEVLTMLLRRNDLGDDLVTAFKNMVRQENPAHKATLYRIVAHPNFRPNNVHEEIRPLTQVCLRRDVDLARELLALPGIGVNILDGTAPRYTPMMVLILMANSMLPEDLAEFAELLLAHPDTDVNARNESNVTVLEQAQGITNRSAREAILNLLLNDPRLEW